ncbi:MAG: glycoside hydrolase family 15 protein [Patescibacteria group bacterium]|nr:glycoside hydrolase family 15 protein [Patescibacteria group bacterium]
MARSVVLGNGNILVGLDARGQVRDFYFPYVGLENHIGGESGIYHRLGVWTEGRFSWFDDPAWEIKIGYGGDTFKNIISARNRELGVELEFEDVVYNEKNILVRKITAKSIGGKKNIKLFFHQAFQIYESHRGDTAYFDPRNSSVIHYKGRRAFLINAFHNDKQFDEYSVGVFESEGMEGTYRDAEDGVLSKNAIEHGQVDSVIGISMRLEEEKPATAYYWVAAGKSIEEVFELNSYVMEKTPEHLLRTTGDFWKAWVSRDSLLAGLDEKSAKLFRDSLFVIRAHADNNGAIIASTDYDMLQYGHDTYSYMWPRDAAMAALALDKTGDTHIVERFFGFCNDVITPDGYFMHKYRPDKSLGSSWHPWIRDGKLELPIQEDETALPLITLWEHYRASKDLEFVEQIYNSLIKRAADFMCSYINQKTGLPHPSYDLWEEKYGTSTFTSAAVYGALMAAGNFANLLGKTQDEERYKKIASGIKEGIITHLYDKKNGIFYKMISDSDGHGEPDKTVDASSVYGLFAFGVLDVFDDKLEKAVAETEKILSLRTDIGGTARYEGDRYYNSPRQEGIPGNPWFISHLWFTKYHISRAKNKGELEKAKEGLDWVVKHAASSGVLSEQIDPVSGELISATPLIWSHAEFVLTAMLYLDKKNSLNT